MVDKNQVSPNEVGEPQLTTPPVGESGWIMNGLNQLNDRVDKIDERLRLVENKLSKIMGWGTAMFFIVIILQVVLEYLNLLIPTVGGE